MRVKTPLRVTAFSLALVLGLAACSGGGSDDENSGTGSTGGGEAGGTYAADLTEPSYLAPAQNCYESECSAVLDLVNDPLVSTDFESGELVFDGLAESIEADEAQTVWTVKLKDGLTFHNDEPVDTDSFLRAWNYSQDPKNAMSTAGFMSRIVGAGEGKEMSGLKKVDDTTFEITLNGPFSQFGQQMSYAPAFAPMAQACMDDLKACNEEPIGTGPYMMDGPWKHDEMITVTKWADYKGDSEGMADTIEFTMFTTPTAAYRDFQNGGVDVLTLAPEVYLEAKGELGDKIQEDPTASLTYLGFPTTKKPYDNVKLRQALSLAIDRDLIVQQVLNGLAKPSTDIPTPPIPGSRDDACTYCTYDPEQAKTLFEESGVDPKSFTMELYFNADAGHEAWTEAAARQIQDTLGIDYKLKSTPWAQYLKLLDAQDFTGPFRLGWSLDYPSPENYLRPIVGTGGDSNYSGYSNKEVDALLVEGDQAATLEESFAKYEAADDIALEDMPIIPMWSGVTSTASSDDVSNVRYDVGEGEIAFNEITVN